MSCCQPSAMGYPHSSACPELLPTDRERAEAYKAKAERWEAAAVKFAKEGEIAKAEVKELREDFVIANRELGLVAEQRDEALERLTCDTCECYQCLAHGPQRVCAYHEEKR